MIRRLSAPHVRKRADLSGSSYQLDFTIRDDNGGRKRYRLQFPTRELALNHWAAVQVEVEGENVGRKKIVPITLGEMIERFHDEGSAGKAPRSIQSERDATNSLVRHLGPDILLTDITPHQLAKWKKKRRVIIAPGTFNRELSCLRRLFKTARAWNHMGDDDPSATITRDKVAEKGVVFLEVHEQIALVEAARRIQQEGTHQTSTEAPYLLPLVVLALHTGLRRGELLNLRWDSIDLEACQISVTNSNLWKSKNRRNRVLRLTPDAVRELLAWQQWFRDEIGRARERAADSRLPPKLQADAEARVKTLLRLEPRPGRLVFPSFKVFDREGIGAPMEKLQSSWERLKLEAWGTVPEDAEPGALPVLSPRYANRNLHALRHTFGVQLARAGVPLVKIKAAMGHASMRTTEIYLRFYPDEGRDVADKLPSLAPAPAQIVVTNSARLGTTPTPATSIDEPEPLELLNLDGAEDGT